VKRRRDVKVARERLCRSGGKLVVCEKSSPFERLYVLFWSMRILIDSCRRTDDGQTDGPP
jgi:hypothetical protein